MGCYQCVLGWTVSPPQEMPCQRLLLNREEIFVPTVTWFLFLFHNGKGQLLSLEPTASERALESLDSRNAKTL